MDPDRWKQLDGLLQLALEHPPEDRDSFIRQTCGGDANLERELRRLLQLHRDAGTFLESPAIEVAAQALAEYEIQEPTSSELAAETILSHYRILEKLGSGG